jgi:hypothetical protein
VGRTAHGGQEGSGDGDDAEYVRFVGAAEHGDAGLGGGFAAEVDAGVVDEHVERLDLCRRGGTGVGVGNVEDQQAGVVAKFVHGGSAPIRVACPDVHGEAGGQQLTGDLLADSAVGAGDDGDCCLRHGEILRSGESPTASLGSTVEFGA